MVPWLIVITENDLADDAGPILTGTGKLEYDAKTHRGILRENLLKIEIHGKDRDSVIEGLGAYDVLRLSPLTGEYDWPAVREQLGELMKLQLADMLDPEKLAEDERKTPAPKAAD